MNFQELRSALAVKGGKITVSHDTLGSAFSTFLRGYYKNQPISITRAKSALASSTDDGEKDTVVITGRASFLEMPDLPVTARFSLTSRGAVTGYIEYRLIGDKPGPNPWKFSRSLPDLPPVWNYALAIPLWDVGSEKGQPPDDVEHTPYVDSLSLSNARYVVSTHATSDPASGKAVAKGINFIGDMRPTGALGILEHTLRAGPGALALHGAVRLPTKTGRTRALGLFESPWSRPDAPGLHLRAPLDLDFDLGNLVLEQTALRIYTPPSNEWMAKNSTFSPRHGYSAQLKIPSADIDIALGADLEWNLPRAKLSARGEGVSLSKLTELADLTGRGSLVSRLPKTIQKAVNGLSKLELTYVALDLILAGMKPTLKGVSAEIGMPGLVWKVWDNKLQVTDMACRFDIANPFGTGGTKRSVDVTVMGTVIIEGVSIAIMATSRSGFTLYARLTDSETIPLKKLLKSYAPKVPAPADLTVDSLRVMIAPGKSYSMAATVLGKPKPWAIPVGRSKLVIDNVFLSFAYAKGTGVKGTFAGAASYGKDFTMSMVYDIPGDIVLRSVLYDVSLSQLVSKLVGKKSALPGKFDIDFESASVLVQKKGSDYVFQVGAQVAKVGSFAFEVRKVAASGWGFAAGMSLRTSISDLPGLGALSGFEKSFKLQRLLLVASSFDAASFQFPDMAQFNTPGISGKDNISLPAQSGGLTAGLCVFADWKLDLKNKQHKMLRKFLGLPTSLGVALQVGKNPATQSKLIASFTTKIQGNPLVCQFGAMMQSGQPALFLNGSLTVKINKKPVLFEVTMLLVSTGMFLSGTMTGTIRFGTVQLSNLAVMTAVSWSGLPSLGIAATINVSTFSSSIALLFDSTNPAKSLFAGAVSDLSLKDVAATLAGARKLPRSTLNVLAKIGIKGTKAFSIPGSFSEALDNLELTEVAGAFQEHGGQAIATSQKSTLLVVGKRGKSWQLTDMKNNMRHYQLVKKGANIQVSVNAQVYCAPQDTNIGTLQFRKGFFLNGTLEILGLKSTTRIEVSPSKGLAIDTSINKALVLYKKSFFQLSAVKGKKGPRLSISTFRQPKNPVKEFRNPHFYLNGKVTLLGLTSSAFVQLTTSGAKLTLEQELSRRLGGGILSGSVTTGYSIQAQLGANVLSAGVGLSLAFQAKLNLGKLRGAKISMGTIKLSLAVTGKAAVGFEKNRASAALEGSFKFQRQTFRFKAKLSVDQASLAQVEKVVQKEIEKAFADLIKAPEKWAKWVKNGLVDGVKDAKQAAKVLKGTYRKSSKDAAKALKGAGWAVDEVGDALQGAFKMSDKAMQSALKGAGYASKSVENYTAKAFKDAGKAIEKGAKDTGKEMEKGAKAVGGLFKNKKKKKKKKKKNK